MAKRRVLKVINQFNKFPTDSSVEDILENEIQRIHNLDLKDKEQKWLVEKMEIIKSFNETNDEAITLDKSNCINKFITCRQSHPINRENAKLGDTITQINNDLIQISSEYKSEMQKFNSKIDFLKEKINNFQKEQVDNYPEEDKFVRSEGTKRVAKLSNTSIANSNVEKSKCITQDMKGLNSKIYSTARQPMEVNKYIKSDVSILTLQNKQAKDTISILPINKSSNRVVGHNRQKSAELFRTRTDASCRKPQFVKKKVRMLENFELVEEDNHH